MQQIIKQIFALHFKSSPQNIIRFTTGYTHFVHQVDMDDNQKFIIRITPMENRKYYEGALYWLKMVEPLNLPFPKILFNGIYGDYAYMILSFFHGTDLNHVYLDLTDNNKFEIVKSLIEIQSKIETLPEAKCFGWLNSYNQENQFSCWSEIMQDMVNSSIKFVKESKLFSLSQYIDVIENLNLSFQEYFKTIRSKPFLDDATTKNLLVYQGRLSGIVDLDWLCFGDKLLPIGLTQASLLSSGYDCKYTDYWMAELKLSNQQKAVVDFYSVLFCLDFMSEIGQTYANGKEVKTNSAEIIQREMIFKKLLQKIVNLDTLQML